MAELQTFFAMGGYGRYVWSAYAITALVLVLNVYLSKREVTGLIQKARRLQKNAATRSNQS